MRSQFQLDYGRGKEGVWVYDSAKKILTLLRGNHILHYGIGRFVQLVWSLFQ